MELNMKTDSSLLFSITVYISANASGKSR